MNDGNYLIVSDIISNINNSKFYIYGKVCLDVLFEETLQYFYYKRLGNHKLYSLNEIEQIIIQYEYDKTYFMIIHFDKFLIKSAYLNDSK